MSKRAREEGDRVNAESEALADVPAAVECEFCRQSFKPRGLKTHQSRCKAKTAKRQPSHLQPPQQRQRKHDRHKQKQQSDSPPPRKYRFPISDDLVLGHLLSFLTNQSQTKLQLATGDHYPSCEPVLSRYCCSCEDDNPALFDGLCSSCATAKRGYKPLITKTEAKTQYGLKDLSGVPCDVRRKYILYARADLDRHALATFGSRRAWLHSLAQHDVRVRKLAATKQLKRDEYDAFLQTLSPAFAAYAKAIDLNVKLKSELEVCSARCDKLVEALKQRGLELRADSQLCRRYIVSGDGAIGKIVDTMEEMAFLFKHTEYLSRCHESIADMREGLDDWSPGEEYDDMIQSCREDVKEMMCVEYLLDGMGLTLPRKWEKCRARLDFLKAGGKNVRHNAHHIYAATL